MKGISMIAARRPLLMLFSILLCLVILNMLNTNIVSHFELFNHKSENNGLYITSWKAHIVERGDFEPEAVQKFNRCINNVPIIRAWEKTYFQDIGEQYRINTSFVKVQLKHITNYIADKYYNASSNNCQLLQKLGSSNLHLFGAHCHQSLYDIQKGFNLKKGALIVGLPNDYKDVIDNNQHVTVNYIHSVNNAIAFEDGDVITPDVHIVPQRCMGNHPTKCPSDSVLKKLHVFDEVFTISQFWGGGFFHNTIEGLPRLAPYLDFLLDNPSIKIHTIAASRFLESLGLNKSRVISGNVRAKHLYMPAGTPCGRASLFNTQMLSKILRSKFQRKTRDVIILVKRSRRRWFGHHDSILRMLELAAKRVNLTVVVYADNPVPSVERTAELFNRAVMVVAPHGAGESNLIFSQPGTVVLEGLCYESPTRINLCYRHLAHVLGMRHYGYIIKEQCMKITAEQLEGPVSEFISLYAQGALP